LVLALGIVGCDDAPPQSPDAGRDAGEPACTPIGPYEVVPSDGVDDPLGAAPDEARAGRLDATGLPDDRNGLADWRAGDFALSNGRVAFLVSAADSPGQNYDPHGGRVVGLGRVEGGAFVETGDYNLLMLSLGRFTLATEAVTVLADGADGGPAVVRASGTLTRITALGDALDGLVPGEFEGVPAAVDYTLRPDADQLEVTLHLRAPVGGIRATLGSLQIFFQAYRTQPWRPGAGFSEGGDTSLPFVAFDDPVGTSFAWRGAGDEPVEALIATSGADIFRSGRLILGACEEGELALGSLVAAGPGLPPVQAALAALDGRATRRITGTVSEADGGAPTDARVHLVDGDGAHVTRLYPDPDGSFDVTVDPDTAELFVWRPGQPLIGPLDASGDTVDVTLPEVGTLRVDVREAAAATPLPARVEVFPAAGEPPTAPESFGERVPGRGRSRLLHSLGGVARATLAPGDYRVRVTRGPEYGRVDADVTVVAGEEVALVADLERVVPTPGVLCADYHIHTTRSVDSSDPAAAKVAAAAADGVEIAVRSDHEWVSDFGPVVDDLGVGAFVRGLAGIELTTFSWGHFGVFPLEPDPTRPSAGAFEWAGRDAPDVFDDVRARPEAPALIINHPRAGGLRQGYFTEAGYDPVTGALANPELWDESFSVVEVFNDDTFEGARDSVVRDWFSLLNGGRRVFAVGSSDSHDLRGAPVGWPRTCLIVGSDDPAEITPEQVRDATAAGRSTISGGIYLTLTGPDGSGPGDEVTGAGERAMFEVRLFAAPRIAVDRLEVIVDGVTTETIPIRPEDAVDPVERARATIEVDVAPGGSWVVFHAAGDAPYDTDSNQPFVVSNPVFLVR